MYCQTCYQYKPARGYISQPRIACQKSTIALGTVLCSVVRIYWALMAGIPHSHPVQQVCIISDHNNVFVSGRWNIYLDNENIGIIMYMIHSAPYLDSHCYRRRALSPRHNLPFLLDGWLKLSWVRPLSRGTQWSRAPPYKGHLYPWLAMEYGNLCYKNDDECSIYQHLATHYR